MNTKIEKKALPGVYAIDRIHYRLRKWIELQRVRFEISYERRQLQKLSPQQLKDIGVDKSGAIIESERRFTDIPENRLP